MIGSTPVEEYYDTGTQSCCIEVLSGVEEKKRLDTKGKDPL